ncbi:hypothetical protein ACH5RR_023814 [Cinchona calisaya]|uniref:C2H2-type domain-containing protein n=1 Tax=Cinchona calisaya TaxID=153742 RepID=A0ABD2ZBP4_9GENT
MEKHICKLCFRNFVNGRALGGHMRSHMMNQELLIKKHHEEEEFESFPSFSSSEDDEEIGMLVDHQEFCFGGAAVDDDSVVVQDRESENESSKNPPIWRTSKRVRKSRNISDNKFGKRNRFCCEELIPFVEAEEPVSSISDTTPEEDVAYCLMMLSKDKWKKEDSEDQELQEEAVHEEQEKERENKGTKSSRSRGKYRCETCNKVFRSYQALGGHRASHKRIKALICNSKDDQETGNISAAVVVEEKKIEHECPVCNRVFSSGQALGGHKRTHVMGAAAKAAKPFSRFRENFIDLNLPAPIDDDYDDISQIDQLSAVSDAEFVNPFK